MVDQDNGELMEGDPEEAGGIGDARVVGVLAAAVGDGQKPVLGDNHVRLRGEVSRSKDAIQPLQIYHNHSSPHDTDDC